MNITNINKAYLDDVLKGKIIDNLHHLGICSNDVVLDLIKDLKEVAKKTKMSQKEVAEVLNATIEAITKTVSKGKKVTLVGFGSFEGRKRAARMGRNPQTGKELKIPAKTVPAFTAGKKFKELVASK